MVQANELRITNKVYDNGKICTIESINAFADGEADVYLVETGNAGMFIDPIPLTEDILLKCGFEYDFISYNLHFGIDWHNGVLRFSQGKGKTIFLPCTHLHQLQNLYFALTQKELTIKL